MPNAQKYLDNPFSTPDLDYTNIVESNHLTAAQHVKNLPNIIDHRRRVLVRMSLQEGTIADLLNAIERRCDILDVDGRNISVSNSNSAEAEGFDIVKSNDNASDKGIDATKKPKPSKKTCIDLHRKQVALKEEAVTATRAVGGAQDHQQHGIPMLIALPLSARAGIWEVSVERHAKWLKAKVTKLEAAKLISVPSKEVVEALKKVAEQATGVLAPDPELRAVVEQLEKQQRGDEGS